MKNYFCFLFIIILFYIQCGGSGTSSNSQTDNQAEIDYRQEMRDFVQAISVYAKAQSANFVIIPQNGHDLLTEDGESDGSPDEDYINAIDGVGREDLFYGYENDNEATPTQDNEQMVAFMDVAEANGIEALVTDYCSTPSLMDDSYDQNHDHGFASFAANERDLNDIPDYPATPYNENTDDIANLSQVRNFLYLINPDQYDTKDDFIADLQTTNYDLIITDLYFQGEEEFTATDITAMQTKANGGSRLVISYMSIGEAEDYRYYWDDSWSVGNPDWLDSENPDWEGNYKVQYWDEDWQGIIFGNNSSYLKKILDAGFDGVYLDIIDAFEYFED